MLQIVTNVNRSSGGRPCLCRRGPLCKLQPPGTIQSPVSIARLLLCLLICALPALWLWDGPIVHGSLAGVTALGLLLVGRTLRPGETEFFISTTRRATALLALPAVWMVIQLLPIHALAHPIWSSASIALGRSMAGSITIDIGASVLALGQYLTLVGVGLWSAAIAVERQRAEWVLFSLVIGTFLVGLVFANLEWLGPNLGVVASISTAQALDCMALGLVLATAAGVRTLERYETRHANPDRSLSALWATFAACAAIILFAAVELWRSAPTATLVGTGYGIGTVAAVVAIRRFGFGPWGMAAIAVPVLLVSGFLVNSRVAELRVTNLALVFASQSSNGQIALGQRILDDTPLLGTGAGTFRAIAPIYREADDRSTQMSAPTAAATIAVEFGRPIFWLIVATMLSATIILLSASLRRGRDSFYPMAGAAALVVLLFLGFINPGILGTAPAVITAATLGLAFAQSRSRTALR